MLPGYKENMLNNHALNMLVNHPVDMPDPALGIGFAENLAPLVSPKLAVKQPKTKVSTVQTLDDIAGQGQGAILYKGDFVTGNYIGEGLS